MEQELQLWDDTRSQVIQFYLARVFRRGNQNKTKLLYHFRIGQFDPTTNSLKPVIEILNRESHLDEWDNFSRKIREIILARADGAKFSPREKDIEICMERILATPQIEVKLMIDGVSYLLNTPGITGHMGIDIKFWTTVDLLKKFQMQLYQILQNREFRSNVEILPELEVNGFDEPEEAEEEEPEEDEDDSDVIKKAKPDTEMMIKVEGSVDANGDSVEVEDWEEEDIDEIGGDDDDDDPKNTEPDEKSEETSKVIKKSEPEPKVEEEKPQEEKAEKVEESKPEEKPEEKAEEEEKPKPKKRGRKPKAAKKDDSDDKKDDDGEEKPKRKPRAKSTAKKTPAKKTTRKPRKTKKADDEKKDEEPKDADKKEVETKEEPKSE